MSTTAELTELIAQKGEEIRVLKTQGGTKEALAPLVAELLSLKDRFKVANNGVPFDPPKVEVKKEKKPVEEVKVEREGPSKKELNKMARKEGRKKGQENEASAASDVPDAPVATVPVVQTAPVTSVGDATVHFSKGFEPKFAQVVASILSDNTPFVVSTAEAAHEPFISSSNGSISGDYSIGRFFARKNAPELYYLTDAWLSSQVDQWFDFLSNVSGVVAAAETFNTHLVNKTFFVGANMSLADVAVYVFLSNSKEINLLNSKDAERFVNLSRWYGLISSKLASVAPKRPPKGAGAAAKAGKAAVASGASKKEAASEEGGGCPPLEGAVMGEVVTRFPPEPSGYLHIGHAKAVLLNQYYAQRYNGKLIIRFDDTNPSKEKDEFEENIIQDLATLNVKGDVVTHTSDHFARCEDYARQMIREGLGYMDDTPQEQMQAERMEKKDSVRRNTSPEENLAIFEDLLLGKPTAITYCLRAKIDMQSVNGTMRDPVMYRYNATPHHRTGTKYKAYPTYDFACPIVDSVEGVTHALRTTEYNDRDEQYKWIINALRLRPVNIWTYGKMNFVNTVLSKRKLTWFVENNHVDGWFDPRFPTIQGCIRRGMNVEALKAFILSQGASRRIITMEWDKFWSDNKKILEETAARYMSVTASTAVPFTITNVPDEEASAIVQIHPSKPELGSRVMRRSNRLLLERDDCNTFAVGEEVTLLRWGNFFIDEIKKSDDGSTVVSVSGRFNPGATNFSKTKKVTWLAHTADVVPCTLVEFDHIITKAKLTDEDDFKDFVNPVTKAETLAFADPCLRSVVQGQVIQFERKGFFRCDKPYGNSPDKPAVLFLIPDGKMKSMSTLSSALGHK